MKFKEITNSNLKKSISIARKIFPNEIHSVGFWPELAYKMSILDENVNFKYYTCLIKNKIVGITGYYPDNKDKKLIWLGWFGVISKERRKGYGTKILKLTINKIKKMGYKKLKLYCGTEKQDIAAQLLYKKLNFIFYRKGKVDKEKVLYYKLEL